MIVFQPIQHNNTSQCYITGYTLKDGLNNVYRQELLIKLEKKLLKYIIYRPGCHTCSECESMAKLRTDNQTFNFLTNKL